jgi:hypothetical protein
MVGGATLLPGAITDQTALVGGVASGDSFLVHDASTSSLRRATTGELLGGGVPIVAPSITGVAGADLVLNAPAGREVDVVGPFQVIGNATVTGNQNVGGTLGVTGVSTLNNLSVLGSLTVNGVSNLSNSVNIGGTAINAFIDNRVNTTYKLVAGSPVLKASGSWTFDGTNLVPRRTPFNCTIARLGVGTYRVTFTTAMSGTGFSASAICTQWTGNVVLSVGLISRTASELVLQVQNKIFSGSGGAADGDIDVLIFD